MMWKEIQNNFKRIRSLKDGRRKDIKNTEDFVLGFVEEDD